MSIGFDQNNLLPCQNRQTILIVHTIQIYLNYLTIYTLYGKWENLAGVGSGEMPSAKSICKIHLQNCGLQNAIWKISVSENAILSELNIVLKVVALLDSSERGLFFYNGKSKFE